MVRKVLNAKSGPSVELAIRGKGSDPRQQERRINPTRARTVEALFQSMGTVQKSIMAVHKKMNVESTGKNVGKIPDRALPDALERIDALKMDIENLRKQTVGQIRRENGKRLPDIRGVVGNTNRQIENLTKQLEILLDDYSRYRVRGRR